jgi:hypothetical protein
MAIGNLQLGMPITPTTGSAQVVLGRDGALLGFFAGVVGTVVLYDAKVATGLPTAILASVTIPAVGWYPFPIALVNGLVANCSAQTTFVVA